MAETLYKHKTSAPPRPTVANTDSMAGAHTQARESFLEDVAWTRLIKIGDWVLDRSTEKIVGGGTHAYLVSRSEFGATPFIVTAQLQFTAFGENSIPANPNINAGIVFGWNSESHNPKYYNILLGGTSILLERIGFKGGDAFRDYEHISKEIPFILEEKRIYQFTVKFASHAIDLFSDNQLIWSFAKPGDIGGRVGLRPWRSQVHCSSFVASTVF